MARFTLTRRTEAMVELQKQVEEESARQWTLGKGAYRVHEWDIECAVNAIDAARWNEKGR